MLGRSRRLGIAVVLVVMALRLLVFMVGTGSLSKVGVGVAKIWDVEVRLFCDGFAGHQPSSAAPLGRQSASLHMVAAEASVRRSETTGVLDRTSPPDVGVYEQGRHMTRWASSSSPLPCNILYIKVHKCGSTTSSGVARRIAAHHNLSGVDEKTMDSRLIIFSPEPAVSASHGRFSPRWKAMSKLHMRSFLWTMIRLPVSRCMSFYYFKLREDNRRRPSMPVDSVPGRVEFLRRSCRSYAFNYLRRTRSDTPESLVGGALVGGVYGFVGLVERYDESLVMLSYLLRIPLSDVLYLKSKEAGSRKGWVRHLPMAEEDPAVRAYAASAAFNRSNARDYKLHAVASAELDRRWRANKVSCRLVS